MQDKLTRWFVGASRNRYFSTGIFILGLALLLFDLPVITGFAMALAFLAGVARTLWATEELDKGKDKTGSE